MAADFQQYYNLNIDELMNTSQFARIVTLAVSLPMSSRTVVKLNPQLAWDENAYLLALIADNIAFQRYEQTGGKGRRPHPIERPKAPQKHVHIDATDGQIQSLLFAPRE